MRNIATLAYWIHNTVGFRIRGIRHAGGIVEWLLNVGVEFLLVLQTRTVTEFKFSCLGRVTLILQTLKTLMLNFSVSDTGILGKRQSEFYRKQLNLWTYKNVTLHFFHNNTLIQQFQVRRLKAHIALIAIFQTKSFILCLFINDLRGLRPMMNFRRRTTYVLSRTPLIGHGISSKSHLIQACLVGHARKARGARRKEKENACSFSLSSALRASAPNSPPFQRLSHSGHVIDRFQ